MTTLRKPRSPARKAAWENYRRRLLGYLRWKHLQTLHAAMPPEKLAPGEVSIEGPKRSERAY